MMARAQAAVPVSVDRGRPVLRSKCACGAKAGPVAQSCPDCERKKLQPKLVVGSQYATEEREADRIADAVMRDGDGRAGAGVGAISSAIQRSTADPSTSTEPMAPSIVDEALGRFGQALDHDTKRFFEKRVERDFSNVRLRADAEAAASALAVDAHAYAVGNHMSFGASPDAPGRPRPPDERGALVAEVANSSTDEGAAIGAAVGGTIGPDVGLVARGAGGAGIDALGAATGESIGGLIGSQDGTAAGTPGNARTVELQPVFFRNTATDPSPTGKSWSRRFSPSNTIWGKLGVSFTSATPVMIDNRDLKAAGSNKAKLASVRATHNDTSKVCVFLTDNDIADQGGGFTKGFGAGAKVNMADRGTSNTLLAHELGHVLGLRHPPGGADANTIMTATESHSSANPTRNTIGNYNRITWPAPGSPTTIYPDP